MNQIKPRKGYKFVKGLFGKYEEIPKEWKSDFLKHFSYVTMGISPSIENCNREKKGLPFYQGATNFGNIYPCPTMWCTNSKRIVEKNKILFTVRAPVGKINITKERSCLGRGVCSLDTLNNDMMYCYFLILYHKKRFSIYAQGTTYDGINREELINIKLSLTYNKKEQQKIASILSNVDTLIENTQKIIDTAIKLKKGLMQKLLTKGIGHTKFKKINWFFGKELSIPEEWEVSTLSEICHIRKSSMVKSDLYVGLEHITQNDNRLFGRGLIEEFSSNKKSFRVNDVLYGKLRPLLNKVWLATEDGYCSTDILPLQINENIFAQILLLILTDYRFLWYAVSTSSGTKMPRTNWSDMKNFLVFVPSLPEQQKIASILSNIDSLIQLQRNNKEKLEHLKKSLMQKLLTGEVRVKI